MSISELSNEFDHERKDDKDYVMVMIERRELLDRFGESIAWEYLQFSSDRLKNDRKLVLQAIEKSGYALQYASEELRNDKDIVLQAVKLCGYALEYANEELRNDKEIVLRAVKESGSALRFASSDLRNDIDVVLEAVKSTGSALTHANEELRNDTDIVLEAVKKYGLVLEYASEELRNDKSIVLQAVKEDGRALQFASEELRNDKEIALEAVRSHEWAIQYVSEEIRNNKDVVLEAVKKRGTALVYVSEVLRNDQDVVLEAVKKDGYALQYASEELRNDRDVVFEAVKKDGGSLKYASEVLRNDQDVVLEAVKKDGYALQYASEELRNDRDIVYETVKLFGYALRYASEELRNDKDIVLQAVKLCGYALEYANEELRNDKEIVLEAVKEDVKSIEYASEALRNDKDFIRFLLQKVNKKIFSNGSEVHKILGKNIQKDGELMKQVLDQNISIHSDFPFRFFSENVNEEEEENDLKVISKCFKEILGSQKVLDIFSPNWPSSFEFSSIGFGSFGVSYKVKIIEGALSGNIKNRFSIEPVEDIPLQNLFKCLKTQSFGISETGEQYEGYNDGIGYTNFVIKIYHNPQMREEKRIKMIEKDGLSIPYHKNVASILFHRNEEIIDTAEFYDDDEEYWKRKLKGLPSGMTEIKTGLLIMKYYKQDLLDYTKSGIISSFRKQTQVKKEIISPAISKLEICRILRGIIHGVCHIHSNFVVHRDLHPKNIFVNEIYGRVWVGDFGCCLDLRQKKSFLVKKDEEILYSAASITGGSLSTNLGGCDDYLAPEITNFDKDREDYLDYSKSDLYSVGMLSLFLIYSICSEAQIIVDKEKDKFEIVYTTSRGKWISEFSVSSCFSDSQLFEFINKHLIEDNSQRISFSESRDKIDRMCIIYEKEEKFGTEDHKEKEEEEEEEEVEGED